MRLTGEFPSSRNRLCMAVLGVFIIFFSGCAFTKTTISPPIAPIAVHHESEIERNRFAVATGEDIIGRQAALRLEQDDMLPDIARHFGIGTNAIAAANPKVDMWVPKAGELVLLPLSFILPDAPRKGIVVNLASLRLFYYKSDGETLLVTTYPVGVGTTERPTPMGQMHVANKMFRPPWRVPLSIAEDRKKKGEILPPVVPPGPDNPLGEHALYLSKWTYLIHGTNKPASVGLTATNGCLRLFPENIKTLFDETPLKTPVLIVDQPYLLGQKNGVPHLEAHAVAKEARDRETKTLHKKLKNLEKKTGLPIDWEKVEQVQAQARGIPVPILRLNPENKTDPENLMEIRHPEALHGKPEIPALKSPAWYILVGEAPDKIEAQRLAAVVNHQGPPIPARVFEKNNSYRVIAGPFNDEGETRKAEKRLKVDLEIEGAVIEPVANELFDIK